MLAHTGLVMTLANSIIGVGILAMPFCFQKCGILLSIVLLLVSNWVTRICCHYLIKSSLLTRRKSFEFLGFQAFGSSGKLLVELCIIGFLLGNCITYFVVVGDLGPQIITKMFTHAAGYSYLRTFFMFAVTVLCILPLGMLKNVDSLSTVCTASIGFYVCLVIKIILESEAHILANDWSAHVVYWQPSGVLQCLPIFSMALSCQMQLFEVFKSISNQSLDKLNGIVRDATWICTLVYIAVGFFGYVAFCTQPFSGNILMNFSPSFGSDVIKIGFILSVAFSFPLVIFPCRASIYSLLYRKGHADTAASSYIPEARFKTITTFIVGFSLCVALMIPSVELIIGLVGSTIGVAICIMFPAACFRKVIKKNNNESSYSLSSFIIVGGFCLMVLGTYANLQAIDESSSGAHLETVNSPEVLHKPTDLPVIKHELLKILEKDIAKADESFMSKEHNLKLPREKVENLSKKLDKIVIPTLPQQMPAQEPILPVDEAHVNVQKIEETASQKVDVEKIAKDNVVDNVRPLNAKNQSINVASELPNKPLPEILAQKPPTTAANLIKAAHSQDTKAIQQTIDKDAIKKDEDIAAEESKNNKATNDELKETKNQLTQLLERKVDEIKEELAKQNKEAQNLVVEKLVEVVEQVEKIGREVQKKDDDLKSVNEIKKKEFLKPLENLVKPKSKLEAQEIANKTVENQNLQNVINLAENKLSNPSNEINAAKEKSLLVKLTAPQEPLIDTKPKPSQVYEPLSYKTGELIEQARNANVLEKRLPLPLALLINSSRIQSKPEEHLMNNDLIEKSSISQTNNITNTDLKIKANIEAIRRDILQLNEAQTPTTTELSNSHQRIKRELETELQNFPRKNKNIQNSQEDLLTDPKIESLLDIGFKDALDFKKQLIGRDLKSFLGSETEQS